MAHSHLALGVVLGVPGQGHPLSQHVLHSHHTRGVGVQVGTASPCAAGAGGGRRAGQGAHLGDIARKQRHNHAGARLGASEHARVGSRLG